MKKCHTQHNRNLSTTCRTYTEFLLNSESLNKLLGANHTQPFQLNVCQLL